MADDMAGEELSDGSEIIDLAHEKSANSVVPNGGLLAWLQVVGSFMLFLNSWGIVNSFGVFQTYYESQLLSQISSSDISWIGSLQAFLLLVVGVITGPLFDGGFLRPLIITGAPLVVFGMMMTSLSTTYWQVLLSQGLCVGIGSGCLFIPSIAIVSTYFSTKKSLALGLAASGSRIAGIIYPIVFHRLESIIGFPWATRVIAFIMLGTLVVPLAVMRVRIKPALKRPLFDETALREPPFVLFMLAVFLSFMGIYIPFFYMPLFAVQEVPNVTPEFAEYTIAIMNAASTVGRIVPNYIADKTGPLNIIAPCALVSAVLAFCWIAVENKSGLIVFCILYGLFTGAFVSIPPSAIVTLSPRLDMIGTRTGMVLSFGGLGLLIGSPIGGAILGLGNNFLGLQIFCACIVFAGAMILYPTRFAKAGWRLTTWA